MKTLTIVLTKLTAGGTERTAVELANYMVANGFKVNIILMYNEDIFFYPIDGVEVFHPRKGVRKKLGKVLYIPYLLWYLRKRVIATKPDTVFCLGYILFGIISCIGLDTKVVISNRTSPYRNRFPGNILANALYHILYKIFKKRVNGIIAQTEVARNVYKKGYKCPIKVIPNFLRDIDYYRGIEKEKVIINVGRLVPEKGHKYLLQSFSKLKQNGWRLWIIGDGPLRKTLEFYSDSLAISDFVEFKGFQKDVDYFLSRASVFAFTSVIEGYPNALVEAMAHGLPPVSFNCVAGPSEIIEDGISGFLVQPGNVDEFARCLQLLVDDVELRNNIRQNAISVRTANKKEVLLSQYIDFLM